MTPDEVFSWSRLAGGKDNLHKHLTLLTYPHTCLQWIIPSQGWCKSWVGRGRFPSVIFHSSIKASCHISKLWIKMDCQPAVLCQCPKEKVIRVFTQNQSTGLCKREGAAVSWRKVMFPVDLRAATTPGHSQAGAQCVSPVWELCFSGPGVYRQFYWESRAM